MTLIKNLQQAREEFEMGSPEQGYHLLVQCKITLADLIAVIRKAERCEGDPDKAIQFIDQALEGIGVQPLAFNSNEPR